MNTTDFYTSYARTHFDHSTLMQDSSYDDMARFYRVHYGPYLPPDKSAPICELGCGAGHFLYFLRDEGYDNVSGVDLSPELVAHCHRQGLTNVEYGDVFDVLARNQQAFQAVICNDLIEHIARARMVEFIGMVRASLTGGVFLVKTINAASLFGAREVFIDFTHEVGFTPESLAQVLRMGGFDDITVRPLRTTPANVKGCIIRLANELLVETMLKGLILVSEGRGSRRPMVLTNTMLAVARP